MRWPGVFRILGRGCDPEAAGLLHGDSEETVYRSAPSDEGVLEGASDTDLVVLTENGGTDRANLVKALRRTHPRVIVALLRDGDEGIPANPTFYDDILRLSRAEEIPKRIDDLARIGRLRLRFSESGLSEREAHAALADLGLEGDFIDECGLLPPGRIRFSTLKDVHSVDRHQSSICEMMGTAYATFRYDATPRPIVDASGHELASTGALAPYCAYLKTTGEKSGNDLCLSSLWTSAEQAFSALRPVERVCAGGVGLFAVPIVLRFGGVEVPLAVLIVATGPMPGEDDIEPIAEAYGVHPEILLQMATESRFWVLHPDKVDSLKETVSNLAESVSHEVSHAYSTAHQAILGLLRETDLRLSEEKLASTAKELGEANERLEAKHQEIYDLTRNITHDLKKPLGAMKTMMSMLQRGYLGELNEKQAGAVDTAVEAGDYMVRLVEDLLESSKLDSGVCALSPEPLETADIVERTVNRLRFQIDEEGVEVRVEPLPRVTADSDALEKILMNLVGNAVSYIGDGPEKRITVRSEEQGDRVLLIVEDTGVGIPEDCVDRIFDKFNRGTNVTGTSGTGLGLAIVKGMVEAHGGRIEVRTKVGEGSSFRFDLARAETPGNDLYPPSNDNRYESAGDSADDTSVDTGEA
jgi:signal transduction histidine kinase